MFLVTLWHRSLHFITPPSVHIWILNVACKETDWWVRPKKIWTMWMMENAHRIHTCNMRALIFHSSKIQSISVYFILVLLHIIFFGSFIVCSKFRIKWEKREGILFFAFKCQQLRSKHRFNSFTVNKVWQ